MMEGKEDPSAVPALDYDYSGVPLSGKVALMTGITGQDGSYLAELLLSKVRASVRPWRVPVLRAGGVCAAGHNFQLLVFRCVERRATSYTASSDARRRSTRAALSTCTATSTRRLFVRARRPSLQCATADLNLVTVAATSSRRRPVPPLRRPD